MTKRYLDYALHMQRAPAVQADDPERGVGMTVRSSRTPRVVLLGGMLTWFVCQMIFPPIAALAGATAMSRRERGFRREHLLRSVMVFGLVAGTTTHVLMVLRLMPVPSAPAAYHWFWNALTVVDPAIAAGIVFAPLVGLVAAAALMIADVAVNVTASGGFGDWAIWFQSAFGVFILVATPYCWNRSRRSG